MFSPHLWSSRADKNSGTRPARAQDFHYNERWIFIIEGENMKANYTFKHLDHSESLLSYTNERLEEVGKFLLKEGYGSVYFSKQKNDFCVEISVNTSHKYFKATATGPDVYAAVDLVVSKLEKQFLKNRKLLQDHKKFELSKEGQMEHLNDRLEYHIRYRKAA